MVPDSMKQARKWLLWRLEDYLDKQGVPRLNDDGSIKKKKAPYTVTGPHVHPASSTNPEHYRTYRQVCAYLEQYKDQLNGIGYVFTGDETGIDLDHCRDPQTGVIDAWAWATIKLLNSYTEISPSGTGVHIYCQGTVPGGRKVPVPNQPDAAIEMYCEGRYFTCTGNHLEGTSVEVMERQEALDAVYADYFPAKPTANRLYEPVAPTGPMLYQDIPNLSDNDLIAKAQSAANGADFTALWNGDMSKYGNDASRADQALCNHLAFWTSKDASRMDRLFRQSGLYRDKWDRNARSGETYGEGTIARAIASCTEVYTGHAPKRTNSTPPNDTQGQPLPVADDVISEDPNKTYISTGGGIIWNRISKEGYEYQTPLTNFTAVITDDVVEDDGSEENQRVYVMKAQERGVSTTFRIAAKDFTSMGWVGEHLGATARIEPGQSIKDHARAAIQVLSEQQIKKSHIYTHTGWREIGGVPVYLHAHGGISQVEIVKLVNSTRQNNTDLTTSEGRYQTAPSLTLVENKKKNSQLSQISQVKYTSPPVVTRLTESLARYVLPVVTDTTDIASAIRASLQFIDPALAPDTVTMPLYASLWRAPLGSVDYSVHITGQTGRGKSELAALCQQHYGSDMHAKALPATWESTDNALEQILYAAKDALVVIDELKPVGTKNDIDRLHKKVDRIFRSVGNGSARQRLDSNLHQRAERRPRCLILSTGEDAPRGGSLKARCVLVDMTTSVTSGAAAQKLTTCQRDAANGLYAVAMTGYVQWLAPNITQIKNRIPTDIANYRQSMTLEGSHARASTNTANMLLGLDYFLAYAVHVGTISSDESLAYRQRALVAFTSIADTAAHESIEDRPTEQWRKGVVEAIAMKSAYLMNLDGTCPGTQYGWNAYNIPSGTCIGYLDGEDVYLIPSATYQAVCRLHHNISTTEATLRKFFVQDKILKTTGLETSRKTITIRKSAQGVQLDVLHLSRTSLWGIGDLLDLVDYSTFEAVTKSVVANDEGLVKLEKTLDYHLTTSEQYSSADVQGINIVPATPSTVQQDAHEGITDLTTSEQYSSADVVFMEPTQQVMCKKCGKVTPHHVAPAVQFSPLHGKGAWSCNLCLSPNASLNPPTAPMIQDYASE